MKHVYVQALMMLDNRIKSCGKALRNATDEYSLQYWTKEINKAQLSHKKILNRSKIYANVINVDFVNRRKVA